MAKDQQKIKRKLALKNKIQSVGRMNLMLSNMRKNQEVLLELKSMSPDGKLPKGALLDARPTIEFSSRQYEVVKGLDKENEKRPKKKWARPLSWYLYSISLLSSI